MENVERGTPVEADLRIPHSEFGTPLCRARVGRGEVMVGTDEAEVVIFHLPLISFQG